LNSTPGLRAGVAGEAAASLVNGVGAELLSVALLEAGGDGGVARAPPAVICRKHAPPGYCPDVPGRPRQRNTSPLGRPGKSVMGRRVVEIMLAPREDRVQRPGRGGARRQGDDDQRPRGSESASTAVSPSASRCRAATPSSYRCSTRGRSGCGGIASSRRPGRRGIVVEARHTRLHSRQCATRPTGTTPAARADGPNGMACRRCATTNTSIRILRAEPLFLFAIPRVQCN
jgi:hypothetical protein